jgi:hypothetical protein
MIAPVTVTATAPSARGSEAAASDPKTAIRIRATIGNPSPSAVARSSLETSESAAHIAGWPTRYGVTPSTDSPGEISSRMSPAVLTSSSASPLASIGAIAACPPASWALAWAAALGGRKASPVESTWSFTRSTAAALCWTVAPDAG